MPSFERIQLVMQQLSAFRYIIWTIACVTARTARRGTCRNLTDFEADLVFRSVLYKIVQNTLGDILTSDLLVQLDLIGIEDPDLQHSEITPGQRRKLKEKIKILTDMVLGESPIWDELQIPLVESGYPVEIRGQRPRLNWKEGKCLIKMIC